MKRLLSNFVASCALLMLMISLTGCRLYVLSVKIPDFDTNHVEGVSLWRLAPRTLGENCYDLAGTIECYDYAGAIIFKEEVDATNPTDGSVPVKTISYYNTQSPETTGLFTKLKRVPNSDTVILRLEYIDLDIPNDAPVSTYRIKTFNAVGESPISSETIMF